MSMSLTPVLDWAADQVGTDARVVAVEGLRPAAGPWRLRIDRDGKQSEAVLRVGEPHHREQVATEAAALAFAEEHRLAAPRLLAVDLDGSATRRPVLLTTVLAGTSRIPATAEVLDGWQRVTGQPAEAVAYWDLVAALTTPGDGGDWFGQWLAVVHEYGRVDLDAPTLAGRRDAFLLAALDQLDRE